MAGNLGKYQFLEDMDSFLTLESQLDREITDEKEERFCNSLQILSDNDAQLKGICKSFAKLFKVTKRECDHERSTYGSKCTEFINYWLNDNLRSIPKYENIKTNVYKELQTKYSEFVTHNLLNEKIYNIDQEIYKNMNILYKLYKIFDQIKQSKIEYDKRIDEFKTIYNKALKQCFLESNDNFFNALEQFRKYYENKLSEIKAYTNVECPTLPQLINKFQKIDSGTSLIGNKLIQYDNINLYNELTKISKDEHKNLMDLVSLQYNLPFEHDKKDNKCLLMNILHEFFQYCDKNKNNKHLLEFIREFINKYYIHMKKNYNEIFEECGPNMKSEKYCEIYNNCNTKFNKDFSLIKNKTENYITQKEHFFNNLTTDESWIDRALAIFKDFDALSKNSPTVLSTLVAIVLCLFFIYKLTPLSSLFRKEKKKRKIPLFFPQRIIQDVKVDNSGYNNPPQKKGKIRFSYQPS